MSRVLPYSYAVYIWEMFVCLVLLFGYNVSSYRYCGEKLLSTLYLWIIFFLIFVS